MGLKEVLLSLKGYEAGFPVTIEILKLAATLGISSATCERSFSCVRRVKSFLRSTMTTDRLSALAILSTAKEFASTIDFDEFLRIFHQNITIVESSYFNHVFFVSVFTIQIQMFISSYPFINACMRAWSLLMALLSFSF